MSGPLGTDHPNSSSGRKSEQGAPNTQGLLCPCLGCLLDIHPSILHPQQLLTLCSGVRVADPTQESKWWLLLHKRQVNFNRRFIPHKENQNLLDLAWDPPSQPYTPLPSFLSHHSGLSDFCFHFILSIFSRFLLVIVFIFLMLTFLFHISYF